MHVETMNLSDELKALRQQLTAVQEQLTRLCQQQEVLCAQMARFLSSSAAARPLADAAPILPVTNTVEVVAECAQDIVRVFREVGQPLTLLEILDELVRRQLSWRENTVRHALDELLDRGMLSNQGNAGPHNYALVA